MKKPKVKVRPIIKTRFDFFRKRLIESDATPLIVVGAGHNKNKGTVVVSTVNGISNESIIGFLKKAIEEIESIDANNN